VQSTWYPGSFTISDYGSLYESEYDPESEADAAMKLAVAAHGLERQKWLNLAVAWRELARGGVSIEGTTATSGLPGEGTFSE
jgi:hypothetical protein